MAAAVSTPRATPARPRIVALGDSLTSGHGIGADRAFPATLQQQLDRAGYAFTVVNAGVSGDTSGRAVLRVRDGLAGDVQVVIVAPGVNDGLRGVPVAEVRRNLSTMLPDRVHPNADGAREIANPVWPYLDALLARTGYSRSAT